MEIIYLGMISLQKIPSSLRINRWSEIRKKIFSKFRFIPLYFSLKVLQVFAFGVSFFVCLQNNESSPVTPFVRSKFFYKVPLTSKIATTSELRGVFKK